MFLFALRPRSVTIWTRFIEAAGVLGDQIPLALTGSITLFLCRSWHAQPSETHANFPFGDLRGIHIIGTRLVLQSYNCHLDVCALRGLDSSTADLIIPDCTRLCQAGPVCNGHVGDVYYPVLRASAMQHLGIRWIER